MPSKPTAAIRNSRFCPDATTTFSMSTTDPISTSGSPNKREGLPRANEPARHLKLSLTASLFPKPRKRNLMCRNIKTLHNFMPPATEDEVRASALQFVRKLSGFTRPSKANEEAFDRAVEGVTLVAQALLDALTTQAPPRDRAVEAAKARARSANRFSSPPHSHDHSHAHDPDHEHSHAH